MVYLQEYSEEAYFRASIRRCDYQIDIDGTKYWIYMRGPVETTVQWNQKHQITFNDMNYTIIMYIPKNEVTSNFFERHKIIKFDNHNWKVNAVDRYSQKGVIEVVLGETFDNEMEEEKIVPEIITPDESLPYICGPQYVKPYDENLVYEIKNANNGTFVVNSSKVKINESTENSCVITILTGKSSSFDLLYKIDGNDDIVLPITIESF